VRLNRYLSQCGLGSRRGCEQIILEGRVSINGRQVKELATQVGAGDQVTVDGRPVKTESGIVIALNKPRGYLCTRGDTHERMTIYDLLPAQFQTLHHVGRLDKESEGLILLTNRGDLSHRLIHPSQGAEKEYEVTVDKPLDAAVMAKLVKGMLTEEGYAKAERAWIDGHYRAHVVLKQGLKRQIRLMFYQLGFEVERLIRTRIGWLELRGMQKGGWKELTAAEVERFFSKEGGGARPNKKTGKPRAKVEDLDEGESPRPPRRATQPRKPQREGGTARPPRAGGTGARASRSRNTPKRDGPRRNGPRR
jgi:23S rRNA pseudouridine2605 synthase